MLSFREFVVCRQFLYPETSENQWQGQPNSTAPIGGLLTPPVLFWKTKVSSHGFLSLKNSVPQILLFYYLCIYLFSK